MVERNHRATHDCTFHIHPPEVPLSWRYEKVRQPVANRDTWIDQTMPKSDPDTPPWKPALGIDSPTPIVIILAVAFVVSSVILVVFAVLKR